MIYIFEETDKQKLVDSINDFVTKNKFYILSQSIACATNIEEAEDGSPSLTTSYVVSVDLEKIPRVIPAASVSGLKLT